MKKSIALDIIASLFILLFIYTGLMKLLDHTLFINAMHKSSWLAPFASILSIVVPLAELLTAAFLLIPTTRKIGFYSSLGLMSIFTVYVGLMLYFQSNLPCTCGGIIQQMTWHQHFYFNSAFTLLSIIAVWLSNRLKREENVQGSALSYGA